eukprot:1160688-Pelagomonas_calceolata.AAC.7
MHPASETPPANRFISIFMWTVHSHPLKTLVGRQKCIFLTNTSKMTLHEIECDQAVKVVLPRKTKESRECLEGDPIRMSPFGCRASGVNFSYLFQPRSPANLKTPTTGTNCNMCHKARPNTKRGAEPTPLDISRQPHKLGLELATFTLRIAHAARSLGLKSAGGPTAPA